MNSKMHRATRLTLLALACAVGLPAFSSLAQSGRNNPPPRVRVDDRPLPDELRSRTSFAPVLKKVAPSVVNIYTTTTVRQRGMNPFFQDPFFRRFFGDEMPERPARPEQSLGSGVIVTPDGYILTASHVVEGADRVRVALSENGQEHDAEIIGVDPPTDIAVLKLKMDRDLPAISLGDSKHLEVGDFVFAIGNPFGVGQTVTMGIVSGVGRGGFGITGYENFIQTDAAINPGNSGGALVDALGRLVGINTAILSRSGGFQGVGFAVPIDMARFVMDQLVTQGRVDRGYLGINIQPLNPQLVQALRLPSGASGVLVGGVSRNSAAEKAGMKPGDVIVSVDGKPVTDPRSLQLAVAQIAPGTQVNIKVLRPQRGEGAVERTLTASLGSLPPELVRGGRGQEPGADPGQNASRDALDGVEVTDLDARYRRQFNIPSNVSGALVVTVAPDSNAAEAGLRPGDVITSIDQEPIENADDAVELTEKASGDQMLLRVWSRGPGGEGGTRFVVVDNRKRESGR